MAEQQTGDTKPSLARRGARPFAGPAGAPGAARPGLRPPAPGQRPAPAPFGGATRSTLGGPAAAAPATPAQIGTEAGQASSLVAPAPEALGAAVSPDAAAPNDVIPAPQPTARPITSEMVALDAIDAFDALWASAGGTATGPTEHTGTGYTGSSHPLDESSLGGLDAVSTWSEDIVGAAAPTPSATEEPSASDQLAMPPWLADDPTPMDPIVEPHASAPSESNADTPGVEAHVAADSAIDWRDIADARMAAPPEVAADPARGHEPADLGARWPEQSRPSAVDETQASPQGPTAAIDGVSLGGARPRFELIEQTAPAVEPAESALPEPRALQVSATLTRLAERVRAGEIDVTSMAPDATDAAVLASVLAALLGGSRSR